MKFKYLNTISEIEYSNSYENNQELFEKGINILKNKIVKNDYSEFTLKEREILENVFTIIETESGDYE